MRPKHITYTIAAGAATAIGLAQTKAGAGALLINGLLAVGGVATIPIARHIEISCVADESLITFTVAGTDRFNAALSEDVTGVAAGLKATTVQNFKTVTGVSVSAALTGNVLIGTADSLETPWIPVPLSGKVDAGVTITDGGSMTCEIQTTMGDVFNTDENDLPVDGATGFAIGIMAATALRLSITDHVSGNVSLDILSIRS